MGTLQYHDVGKAILEALPELADRYAAEANWQAKVGGQPGQYDIVGYVMKPFLNELLDADREPALMRRLFDFMEEMARSCDIQVINLLQVQILESLLGEPKRLRLAWGYMGEETRKLTRTTARIHRCERNLPEQAAP